MHADTLSSDLKAGSQYDAKMRCVVFSLTLVEKQHDARIDSDPMLAFPCVAFLRQVVKKSLTFLVNDRSSDDCNSRTL